MAGTFIKERRGGHLVTICEDYELLDVLLDTFANGLSNAHPLYKACRDLNDAFQHYEDTEEREEALGIVIECESEPTIMVDAG